MNDEKGGEGRGKGEGEGGGQDGTEEDSIVE